MKDIAEVLDMRYLVITAGGKYVRMLVERSLFANSGERQIAEGEARLRMFAEGVSYAAIAAAPIRYYDRLNDIGE